MTDEPRWSVLFVVSFLLGLMMAGAPQWAAPEAMPSSPAQAGIDWLLALAVASAWHCHTRSMWIAMAWCGLMSDLFQGGRLGTNVLLFMGAGMVLDGWRHNGVRLARWGMRWLVGWVLALGVGLLRPWLQAPSFWLAYAPDELGAVFLSAFLTAAMVPLVEALMAATGLRTWRSAEPFRHP